MEAIFLSRAKSERKKRKNELVMITLSVNDIWEWNIQNKTRFLAYHWVSASELKKKCHRSSKHICCEPSDSVLVTNMARISSAYSSFREAYSSSLPTNDSLLDELRKKDNQDERTAVRSEQHTQHELVASQNLSPKKVPWLNQISDRQNSRPTKDIDISI